MKDIVKTVLVLAIIALISGTLLGVVNGLTYVDEEELLKSKLIRVYDTPSELERISLSSGPSIEPVVNDNIANYGSVTDAFVSADGTYVLKVTGKGGYGGDIEMLYAIKDYRIESIAVFSHEETPGLGAKGFEEDYLEQFYNQDLKDIELFVLEDDIDALSGATYTSNAIVNASNVAAIWYKNNAIITE